MMIFVIMIDISLVDQVQGEGDGMNSHASKCATTDPPRKGKHSGKTLFCIIKIRNNYAMDKQVFLPIV